MSSADKSDLLKTRTETRGENLSGGFAQSVALARIFLRPEAKLVILDEAMSQMDAIKRHEHALPRLFQFVKKHNQTLIIISHDVRSVAERVDRIFVMDKGRCVHQGSHSFLVASRAAEYMKLIGEHDRDVVHHHVAGSADSGVGASAASGFQRAVSTPLPQEFSKKTET